jgi:opacity protein-like surface antigen
MLGGGGGVNVALTEGVSLDAGYRYLRLYAEDGINVNRVYVGVGFGF